MLYVFNLSSIKYLNVILHVIYCRWKIQQQFTNDQKYMQRSLCSQRPWHEFRWIVDLIQRYRNVTELVRNKFSLFPLITLNSKSNLFFLFRRYVDLINHFSNVIYLIVVFFAMVIVVIDLLCVSNTINTKQYYQSEIVIKRRIFDGFYLNKVNLIQ